MKGWLGMFNRNSALGSIILALFVSCFRIGTCEDTITTAQEKQQFDQINSRVIDIGNSITHGNGIDINTYKSFADSIDLAWRGRNREYYASLMFEICRPLTSDQFRDIRKYDLARKYALSALDYPDSIPLRLEIDLIGYVITFTFGPGAPVGEEYAQKRVTDATIRLHAWKRLLDGIDPNWDSSKIDFEANVNPPVEMLDKMGFFASGMDPDIIQDSTLRAEYKELIRLNREKREKYTKQHYYHDWLRLYSEEAESSLIDLYSQPPFAIEELTKILNDQLPDQEAKARIIATVEKNMSPRSNGRESPKGIH